MGPDIGQVNTHNQTAATVRHMESEGMTVIALGLILALCPLPSISKALA